MSGISSTVAQTRLEAYLAAEAKILLGQSVQLDGQTLTRANLADVQRGIALWETRLKTASLTASGRGRMRTVAPV
jgi:hypothetical protein